MGAGVRRPAFRRHAVIASKNEIQYIHHRYTLESIHLDVPPGVAVVREPRVLSGDGAPDLKPPAASGVALAMFAGHWTFGFEQSSFVPCGSAERFWLDTGRSTLPAQREAALGPAAPRDAVSSFQPGAGQSVTAGQLRSSGRLYARARSSGIHRRPAARPQRLRVAEVGPPSCPSLTSSRCSRGRHRACLRTREDQDDPRSSRQANVPLIYPLRNPVRVRGRSRSLPRDRSS